MTGERHPTKHDIQTGGIRIGDVQGGIRDAIIAGRDVIIYEGIKPITAGDLLDACQAQIDDVLFGVRHKYNHELYVNRAIEHELETFFDVHSSEPAPNCYLIVAPAGSGKTNLLCDLARRLVQQQPVLLLLGGNTYVSSEAGLLCAVQNELEAANADVVFRNASDSLHTLHRLAEELDRDALLFVDAINEHGQPAAMRQALEDLLAKTRRRRVKLVITCRDYYWGLFKGPFWAGATVNGLPADDDDASDGGSEDGFSHFAADEYDRALPLYLEHYDIHGRPVGDAAVQCRHPLLLLFFCEAYRGQEIGDVEDIRLKELFDQYWGQKLAFIAEKMVQQGEPRRQDMLADEVGDYLLSVAGHMLHRNVRAIPLAELSQATGLVERRGDLRSIYGRIRDEFIILEETERGEGRDKTLQVAFVYEKFMEYVMARSLLRDWDRVELDQAGILAEIEALTDKYESFAQILGVMVYLSLMLKESRGLALWSLLFHKGEHWRAVVFETFRKLPESELDASVFDALGQMLATGSENIQIQVLDTLKLTRVGRAAPSSIVDTVTRLVSDEREPIARRATLGLGNMTSQQVVPVLLRAAQDPRASVQQNAATSLDRLGMEAVEPLISALQDSNWHVRQLAASALGQLGDICAVQPLISVLEDDNSGVRRVATEALGQLRDVRAAKPVIALLKDTDENVRQAAATALRQVRDVRAMEPLIAALKDSAAKVRRSAAAALAELGDARAVEPLIAALMDSAAKVRRSAARALGQLGDARAVETLITVLGDSVRKVRWGATWALGQIWSWQELSQLGSTNPSDRQAAAAALGQTGDIRAVEPLIAALKDSAAKVRRNAAAALAELGDARAVEPLIAALKDSAAKVRRSAARALGQLGDALAVEPLITVLEDSVGREQWGATWALGQIWSWQELSQLGSTNPSDRQAAAAALGQTGDIRAVEPLIAALRDRVGEVRQAAATALGQMEDIRAVGPIVAALRDRMGEVRWGATWALGQIWSWQELSQLGSTDPAVRVGAATALAEPGDIRAVEALIAALRDTVGGVRQAAAAALGQMGDARAIEPLTTALGEDNDEGVRQATAAALGKLGDVAVDQLIVALIDSEAKVRWRAANALGQLGYARAVEPLIVALGNSDDKVRWSAAKALGQLGDTRAVEPLIVALRDSDARVRWHSAKALGQLGDVRAVEPLIGALRDSDVWLHRGAAEALQQLGDASAVQPLIVALRDSDVWLRQRAAQILGHLGDARAVEPLIVAIRDSDEKLRRAAAEALGNLGDVRAVEPLVAALQGDDKSLVHKTVVQALTRIGTPEALAAVQECEEHPEQG